MTIDQQAAATSPTAAPLRTLAAEDREEFLAAIVDSADDAIFAKALDGTIMSWNAGAQRMYGYTPDEVVGHPVFMLAPPERKTEIDGIMARLRAGKRIEHFETVRVRKNGQRFPVSLAISPVRDAKGVIIGASTIARDISEQRRLAESLVLQKSLLTAQNEASIEGILVVGPTGRVLFCNRRYIELWGHDEPVGAGTSDEDLLATASTQLEDPVAFVERARSLYDNRDERARDELRLRDGRVFERYTAPVRAEDGGYFGRVWFFRDVTAETMRSAQLQAVIAAVEVAAIVFDGRGRALLRNPAAERMLPGVGQFDEVLADLVAADAEQEPQKLLALGTAGHAFARIRVADDDQFVEVSTRPIRLPDPDADAGTPSGDGSVRRGPFGLGTLLLLRDLTELREAQLSREAFLGVLSHELRTPITTIFGAGKMLERASDEGVRTELLHDIVAESDRLYRLVEDLLVLTRIERESLEIVNGPIRIGPVVDRVVAAERTANPAATIEVTMAPQLPIVLGEETYVEQVLRNLIGNAIKYGPRAGRVTVLGEPATDGGVAIRVLDEGPGIAGSERDRVFELLYRSPATAAQAAGSGIGLFVSRRLADAMGGSLSAQPRDPCGAEFVLTLARYDEARDLGTAG
jgi:PAS domain S-box-containing protein